MSRSFPASEALAVRSDEDTLLSEEQSRNPANYDPIAQLVIRRWWDATQWMQSDTISTYSVEQTLFMCDRQRRNVYEPDEVPLLGGIDIYVPLTDMKCMAAEAWLRDMLGGVSEMPWTIAPTPIPELPERMKLKVLRDLKMEIVQAATEGNALATAQGLAQLPPQLADIMFGQMIAQFPGDIEELAATLKESQKKIAFAEATKSAGRMETLIRDQCVEMNFQGEMNKIFYDLVTFPAAILKGPILSDRPRIVWNGNRRVVRKEERVAGYRVAPFDIKPSPDSSNTQDGTYLLEKTRMTRRSLNWALGEPFWIDPNVKLILEEYRTQNRNWLIDDYARNPEVQSQITLWREDETIESLEHHGILSGRELRPYGIQADDLDYYETKCIVSGYRTLFLKVNGSPHVTTRPYHKASYENHGDRFWNTCPVLKLRDTQRTVNSATRALVRNLAFSSGPQVEIDVSRVKSYVANLEDLLNLSPYQSRFVDSDLVNGGRPAYTYTNVPEIISKLHPVINYYMKLADDVSNIPAYAAGEPDVSGAGRTFRGFSAVFAQALKIFKMPVQNLDQGIFQPFAQSLYDYNMTYSKDQGVKGDAIVMARGSSGLVERELHQQKAMETMQIVAQMTPAAAQIIPEKAAKVMEWTWAKALEGMGVPIDQFGINPDIKSTVRQEGQLGQPGSQTPIPPIPGSTESPG